MMTELLLAVYPDVFKAGSALAGMPAGCRGDNESGNGSGYSGACAGGNVTRSPEEWGAIVRAMHPGYEGHRPRVQLFHGDADDIIDINNHTEAIKEWTDVLGLGATPTRTEMGVQLGNHQATRETWDNDCGFPVLDAFTSLGGDHGPSDALFPAEYVIPFLGLDQTGPVDPEVEMCGDGPTNEGGAGGDTGVGGPEVTPTPFQAAAAVLRKPAGLGRPTGELSLRVVRRPWGTLAPKQASPSRPGEVPTLRIPCPSHRRDPPQLASRLSQRQLRRAALSPSPLPHLWRRELAPPRPRAGAPRVLLPPP